MFGKLGDMLGMMKNLPKLQEQMQQLQARLAHVTAEGDAGGGMVRIRVNGHLEVQKCTLTDEAMKLDDKELLEDLIAGAMNQAVQKARQAVTEETSKMASDMGLPPGINLPGMS